MTNPIKIKAEGKKIKNGKRIKCFFCKEPIHISRFGGVFSIKGEVVLYCSKISCLIELSKLLGRKGKSVQIK